MNTRFLLMAEFGTAQIPVERIAKTWFGISYDEARRQIRSNQFPLPVFQLVPSAKAPWLVRIEDLADYIDKQAESAKRAKKSATDFATWLAGAQ